MRRGLIGSQALRRQARCWVAASVAVLCAAPGIALSKSSEALVFAAVGPELREYGLDAVHGTLRAAQSMVMPADVQSAWVEPAGRFLLVAWSDGTNVSAGTRHALSTVRIDPRLSGVSDAGEPVALPSRPIYVSTDGHAQHALVTYTTPSGVTVHPLDATGTVGAALTQPAAPMGIYGHQFVVDPANATAILVGRGNVPSASHAEDPGSLEVFRYRAGALEHRLTIAPNAGIGFHPRYLAFHPTQPWLFVSLSQQNELATYRRQPDGVPQPERLFEKSSLADPQHVQPGQLTGALHLHPSGRFAYLANRAVASTKVDGKQVFNGGENSIAVFEIDQRSGEPTLVQTIDTRGIGPVEFALDPSARFLVVANMMHQWVRAGGELKSVDPSLVVFRVHDDGTLAFASMLELPSEERNLFWMGMSARP